MVIPNPLSPTPSNSSDMRIADNTEKDPDDSEAADEGDLRTEYALIMGEAQIQEQEQTINCKNFGHWRNLMIIQNSMK